LRSRARRYLAGSGQEPLIADQVAIDYRKADLTPQ